MGRKTYCRRCSQVVDWSKDWLKDPDGTWHWGCAPKHSKAFFYDKVAPQRANKKSKGGYNGRKR